MANIDISSYRNVVQKNASTEILVDRHSGELRLRGGNAFNRAVSWIKDRFQDLGTRSGVRGDLRRAEREAAHNSFVRALGTNARVRYERGEIERVQNMLASDAIHNVPLSVRRVREVFSTLDQMCPQTLAENRAQAAWVAGKTDGSKELQMRVERQLAERPVLTEAEYEPSKAQMAALEQRIYDAILASGDRATAMKFEDADRVAEQVTGEFLDEREQHWLELKEEEARMMGIVVEDPPDPVAAPAPEDKQAASQPAAEENRATAPAPTPAAEKTGPRDGKARRAERGSANWIVENRLNRWYREALGATGRSSKSLQAPEPLASRIRRQLGGSDPYRPAAPYEQIKARGRAVVAKFVQEFDAKSLNRTLADAKLPREVETHAKALMRKGAVRDHATLAAAVNEKLADWVIENRLGQWCFEATDRLRIGSGKQLSAPGALVGAVADAITGQDGVAPYAEVKANMRSLITDYVGKHPDRFGGVRT